MENTKNKILIIEDEVILRRLIKGKLMDQGFQVLEASDGKAGLEIALNQKPDVILLDILMPIMDGPIMLKELRKTDYGKTVPVIILSNLDKTKEVGESLENNGHDYYIKSNMATDDIVEILKDKINKL